MLIQNKRFIATILVLLLSIAYCFNSIAQSDEDSLEEITVYGSSPLSSTAEDDSLPYSVQSFQSEDFESKPFASVANILDQLATGVSVNHAQNNPLQPDVQVRGFSASPLLGAPQGVAVYLNGVRVNEPFGDTVNWDLLAPSSINNMSLISGTNAAYGLNALGASLTLASKTGFDVDNSSLGLTGGSFGRKQGNISTGGNNGRWGFFVDFNHFEEEGWRDFSPTESSNVYATLNFRGETTEWDVFGFYGDSNLQGNGAVPEELLSTDREAIFTHPDITENDLMLFSSRYQWFLNSDANMAFNVFLRTNDTSSFNGDGSEYEECAPPLDSFLCDDDDPTENLEDQFGNNVASTFDAINNLSEREQQSWGGTLEHHRLVIWGKQEHRLKLGFDLYQGDTYFASDVEYAQLLANRGTNRSGLLNEEDETALDSSVQSLGLYLIDTFAPSEELSFTLSLRYNGTKIVTKDRSGDTPELNGDHGFIGLNGGLGAIYHLSNTTKLFGNLHQSSRAPSPVELACSHPNAPCNLPNTFLADPPLDEVIARNVEIGLRHQTTASLFWELNTFLTRIADDIIFQSTGGVSSNEGFFSNASDTQRLGLSTSLRGEFESFRWQVAYAWLDATYEDKFSVSSPNHPDAINNQIPVASGDEIPGLPNHSVSASFVWKMSDKSSWELDGDYQSGVYLRGDEGNLDSKTDAFLLFNTSLQYRVNPNLEFNVVISNVFDKEFESFGLYGEPDEVIPSLGDENTRFLSPSEPRGAWLGLRWEF